MWRPWGTASHLDGGGQLADPSAPLRRQSFYRAVSP
jgi:hypothetical protein